ncbi:MAG: Stp1/IreP family PP2C-type Ser/Thr phosphatase [Clostridia bacterium]|nr:Stp1/IreP family PP2C-type Ser/Thr phosphatase [Clostridia bacterium]
MNIYSLTDVGRVRDSNQDAFWTGNLSEDTALCIVCDGMGGANAGNIASQTAVQLIADYFTRSYRKEMTAKTSLEFLCHAISSANIQLYDLALKTPDLTGMGTTVVAAVIGPDYVAIAHVGDSRCYLLGENLQLLTRDHSVVQNLIESGKITPEQAKVHPRKNVITRALGTEENILIDTDVFPRIAGQRLLLCTDGLSGFSEPEEIEAVFSETEPSQIPERLIALANQHGGGDNITAVTVEL